MNTKLATEHDSGYKDVRQKNNVKEADCEVSLTLINKAVFVEAYWMKLTISHSSAFLCHIHIEDINRTHCLL